MAFAEAGTWESIEDLTKDVYTPAGGHRLTGAVEATR